jgi:hypothetical protein
MRMNEANTEQPGEYGIAGLFFAFEILADFGWRGVGEIAGRCIRLEAALLSI